MTYKEALAYIHSVSWKGSVPGLSRITELCHRLGDPQHGLRYIHVTGTNGKGSTSVMFDTILRAAGYRTGLFTSPYVRFFNERMMVDGCPVSDEKLAEVTSLVKVHADEMEDKPTEFELITAIAFLLFKMEKCDVVILEVGMGGRLDSTNVISDTLLSVITSVSLDHTAYLGNTIEAIAAEKAGIIKHGCPVLFSGDPAEAEAVIRAAADKAQSHFCGVDFSRLTIHRSLVTGTDFSFGAYEHMHISLAGLYQPRNAALVLSGVDILRTQGLAVSDDAVRTGLAAARWPARFEILRKDPLVIFDGGHNPHGVRAATETVKAYFPGEKIHLLSGVLADKDHTEIVGLIAEIASEVTTVTPDNPRALDSASYAAEFAAAGIPARAAASIEDGVRLASQSARLAGRPLLILGSLYLYADVTRALALIP